MPTGNILWQLGNAGGEWLREDPGDGGTLKTPQWCMYNIVTAGSETRVLPQPMTAGKLCIVNLMTDGGSLAMTFVDGAGSDLNFDGAGNNVATFAEAGDIAMFISVKNTATTFRWALIAPSTVAVA